MIARTLVVATVLAVCSVASAQRGPSEDRARAEAMPIFNRGLELVEEQRWAEALDRFIEAHRIFESPTVLFNIGYCQRALGRYVEALDTFRRFLDQELTGLAATRAPEARGYVSELESRVAHLEIAVREEHRGHVEIAVNGRSIELGATGATSLSLDPGVHTVQARRQGFEPLFVDAELGPGERERIAVALVPLPARLSVTANVDDARVILDGESIGVVPFDAEVPSGRHDLRVESDGYVAHAAALNLAAGDAARVRAELTEAPAPITARWWFWTGIVAIVAGAAIATYVLTRPEPEPPPYDGGNLDWVVGAGD